MKRIKAGTLKDLQAWLNSIPWPVEAATSDGYSAGWMYLSDLERASWCPECLGQLTASFGKAHAPRGWPAVEVRPDGKLVVHWSASKAHTARLILDE